MCTNTRMKRVIHASKQPFYVPKDTRDVRIVTLDKNDPYNICTCKKGSGVKVAPGV